MRPTACADPRHVTRNVPRRAASSLAGAVVAACTVLAGTVLAAPVAGASTVATSGLTRVSMTSLEPLPPPYRPGHAVLRSPTSLRTFAHTLRSDHIGTASHATNAGACTGGTVYTVVLSYKTRRRVSLYAYECGGSVTGNMTGDVDRFLEYLTSVMS
jgi:hypothetical protein